MFGEVKMNEMNNMAYFFKLYGTFRTDILVVIND